MSDSVFDDILAAKPRVTFPNEGLCRVCLNQGISTRYNRDDGGRRGMCSVHYKACDAKVKEVSITWEELDERFPFTEDARGPFKLEPTESLKVIKLREAEFQNHVVYQLIRWGHSVWHLDPTKTRGIPDLLIVTADGRAMFRELKTESGQTEESQLRMIQKMRDNGCDVDVWRPEDFNNVENDLR